MLKDAYKKVKDDENTDFVSAACADINGSLRLCSEIANRNFCNSRDELEELLYIRGAFRTQSFSGLFRSQMEIFTILAKGSILKV